MFSIYAPTGNGLFTTTVLENDAVFNVVYKSVPYELLVLAKSFSHFKIKDLQYMKMEEHPVAQTLINIIIKEAFRQTDLKQIGRNPKFFDISKTIDL